MTTKQFAAWLPWGIIVVLLVYIYKMHPQTRVQTIYYPDTITSPNQLDAYLSTAQNQHVYDYPGAITLPGGDAWV